MAWRLAKSLEALRAQINADHPNRSKTSDGTIGDTAHASRPSDHNPNIYGVVTALDITHDPANGVDTWKLAETLRLNKDPRIKYVISNGRIFSSAASPWQWRPYTGANKHARHIHVSAMGTPSLYDLASDWTLSGSISSSAPRVNPPKGITTDMRRRMMQAILGFENNPADRGHLIRVTLIHGEPEIAGITKKDHPQAFASLKSLMDAGKQDQLREGILSYYQQYTALAQGWTDRAGLEFFLRDCILNRGPTGAVEILQMALGVTVDHHVGPKTREALAALDVDAALAKLRLARERYEEKKYGKQYRIDRGQWSGLIDRWNGAVAKAKEFQKEQGKVPLAIPVAVGVGIFATLFGWLQAHPVLAALIAVFIAVGIIAIIKIKRNRS